MIKSRFEGFERRYGMKTSEFLRKFESSELGDDEDYFVWWSMHQVLAKIEERLRTAETCLRSG